MPALLHMAAAIKTGLKEENIVMNPVVAVLHWVNIKLPTHIMAGLDWPTNFMALIKQTAMLLKDLLCCIHMSVYRKQRSKMISAKVMDARQWLPVIYNN